MKKIPKISKIPVIRLSGVIKSGIGKGRLSVESMEKSFGKAFTLPGARAVVLLINSPGGSAGQSEMLYRRLMEYKKSSGLPVFAFVEDAAASGGYMIACAADEIFALESSIVGSIGVVSGGFGFVDAIAKLGITRRVYTAGEKKATMDPFKEENPEDIERIKKLQADIHDTFKGIVLTSRGQHIKKEGGEVEDLFTGEFWGGREALDKGLIDGIGTPYSVMKDKVGSCQLISVVKHSLFDKIAAMRGQASLSAPSIIDCLEDHFLNTRVGI